MKVPQAVRDGSARRPSASSFSARSRQDLPEMWPAVANPLDANSRRRRPSGWFGQVSGR
jgi:hypothetical protein